ncbi:MAG: acylphosphatase [Kiloniellales bacterium]|nr:acylphosphatase [Kiloniellales bacterium]
MKQVRVVIAGRVQGVGFRYWTQDEAQRRGLDGWVRNLVNGRVEACFQGDPDKVDDMLRACHEGPRFASVLRVEIFDSEEAVEPGFQILPTGG